MTKKLSEIQKEINKLHGENTLVALGDQEIDVPRISTGILAVDEVLGGGFPKGKMVEIYGSHGGGKTSIAMKFIGEAQKHGKCVLIDLENAFDPYVAENSGINVPELLVAQPDTAENTLTMVESLVTASDVSAIVVDSVAGLTPRAEMEGDIGDANVGLVARILSQAMRKINTTYRQEQSDCIIVWINQVREKIGVMGYGPTTDSTGGRSLKFWCSTRLEVARTGAVKQGEDIIGHTVKAKAVKNRYAAPFQTANFDILYDSGISNESTLLDLAVKAGLVEKGGAWFTFLSTGEKVQGKPAALATLREDPALFDELLTAVRAND
jgi:recombination protein RecA